MHTLSVTDVAIIARTARSTKTRTKLEAWTLLKRVDTRLKQASTGELALAADVRLDLKAVVRLLWICRKLALAQWKEARAAEQAAEQAAHNATYDRYAAGEMTTDEYHEAVALFV